MQYYEVFPTVAEDRNDSIIAEENNVQRLQTENKTV